MDASAQGDRLARQVADAADAWLRDPRDIQVYARLVAAVESWREHVQPVLEGTEHAGRRDPMDDPTAYPATDGAAAVAAAISSPPQRLDKALNDVLGHLRVQPAVVAVPPTTGGMWTALLALPVTPVHTLRREQVPVDPGVYLWRRGLEVVYVGTAASLRTRLWGRHLGGGVSLAGSSLRRNVCDLLFGIAPNVTGNPTRQKVTREQASAIRTWLLECDLSWQTCETPADASALEERLRRDFMPRLNRI